MNSAVSVPAETDKRWMRAAIAQSRHAEGRTQSNPPVGCVILDKSGRLCAAAHTGLGGVPHAETQALDMAGKSAEGGTVYVTLNHARIMEKRRHVSTRLSRQVWRALLWRSGS